MAIEQYKFGGTIEFDTELGSHDLEPMNEDELRTYLNKVLEEAGLNTFGHEYDVNGRPTKYHGEHHVRRYSTLTVHKLWHMTREQMLNRLGYLLSNQWDTSDFDWDQFESFHMGGSRGYEQMSDYELRDEFNETWEDSYEESYRQSCTEEQLKYEEMSDDERRIHDFKSWLKQQEKPDLIVSQLWMDTKKEERNG